MPSVSSDVPRLFLACAPSDLKYAEIIVAKARHERLPIAFDTFSEGRATDVSWQLECRRRIRGTRALIAILSPRTRMSPRAVWQVQCARDVGVPVVAISVAFGGEAPESDAILDPDSVLGWKWKTMAAMFVRLTRPVAPDEPVTQPREVEGPTPAPPPVGHRGDSAP